VTSEALARNIQKDGNMDRAKYHWRTVRGLANGTININNLTSYLTLEMAKCHNFTVYYVVYFHFSFCNIPLLYRRHIYHSYISVIVRMKDANAVVEKEKGDLSASHLIFFRSFASVKEKSAGRFEEPHFKSNS
jgi:hypothetical protein